MDYLSWMLVCLAVLHVAYAGYLYNLVKSGVKAKPLIIIFLVAAVIDLAASLYILK